MKDLSVVISCRNEIVGTITTMRSALEEFKTGIDGEVVICDNSDDISYWDILKNAVPSEYKEDGLVKLVRQPFPCIFTAREKAIRNSVGKYIVIVDSHSIFGRDSLSQMIDSADKHSDKGFIYGLMNFSRDHETESFCDRNVSNFLGVRYYKYSHRGKEDFEVPFRGMPFLFEKRFFNKIDGYGALSRLRLSWGGGDFILGLKSAMMGFRNWMNPNALVIHLGPFKDDDYFPTSYIREAGREYPKRFGMLITAYIVGGERLLMKRVRQLSERIGFDSLTGEDLQNVVSLGNEDYKWLAERTEVSYDNLIIKFRKMQKFSLSPRISRVSLPKSDGTLVKQKETRPFKHRKLVKNSWLARVVKERDRLNFEQSGAMI